MTEMLYTLSESNVEFPPVDHALKDPNGLLAIGGKLIPERILNAYQQGIFPWFSEGEPTLWWSPDPRAVLFVNDLKINRTLRKFIRNTNYRVSLNKSFERVIEECADETYRKDGTWILPEMKSSYKLLHKLGYAHSIEIWSDDTLVGGLYGIAINGYFSGESMFYRKQNASKLALVALCILMKDIGGTMIDCQLNNPFLESMGCTEVKRNTFLSLKNAMLKVMVDKDFWQPRFLDDIFKTA